ncbi:MAG TPA: hypothetical protein VFH40_08475 [Gemmatimonadales bacterium]|nr:hypothetical protein [Gemmatimonadales bacterium]
MNRLSLGTAVLVLSVAAASCGDPTGDLRGNVDKLVATPSAVTLDQGATQNVVVRAVDEQGNEVIAPVDAISVNPANLVTVTIDSSFLAGTDTTGQAQIPTPTKTQLVVTGVDRNAGTITVSAAGKTLDIPVRVVPVSTEFDATFSNQAPALAEQVTLTAPAGFTFTDSSVVSFPGAPNPLVSVAPDGSSLTFLPAANTVGHATITHVVPNYAPGFSLEFTTIDTIATPIFDSLDVVFSTTTPTPGQQVTMTAPTGFRIQPTAAIAVAGIPAIVNSIAADSSSVTFQITPGTVGGVTIDSAVISVLPEFPLSINARDTIIGAPLTALGGTNSPASAPITNAPGLGFSAAIFDVGSFVGNDIVGDCDASCPSKAQYYRLNITEAGDYTVSLDWDDPNTDLDGFLCNDAACSAPQLLGSGGDHPEATSFTALTPGTYFIDAVLFDNIGPVPGTVTITITHDVPAGP